MDVFDRYASQLEDQKRREFDKFRAAALQYTEDGLSEDMVSELLQLDGCSIENSHKLAEAATDHMPDDYLHGQPPNSFEDVSKKVENTIKSASINDLEKYFSKYVPNKYSSVLEHIKVARATGLPSHYREVVAAIRPWVDSLIVSNKTNFSMGAVSPEGKKESLEKDLWGVWSTELLSKFANRQSGESAVLKKAEMKERRYPFTP